MRTALLLAMAVAITGTATAQDKPNILVVWGDDIGQSNISAYTRGMMGYETPNIDRIANEGMIFTDYYGEQSCTAGRSSFITGQSVFRTGLSKVGLPGADLGLRVEDPTIAGLLKAQGYATGQFGKNHLGDKDEFLPTNHGFDEFLGNLYHLNAEEEPENEDYPGDMVLADGSTFQQKFGPRGVIRSYADGRIEDTGPLTKKRMETIDDETVAAAIDFIERQNAAGKPWFVWWSGTRMHFRTHVKEEHRGISGQDEYSDGMVEHDMHIGEFLKVLDELGIADNTIVFYSTDNGPHYNTWPDAASTPFFGEKNTNWEGGWRVPAMVRWPGKIKADTYTNEIVHHMDWLPTFLAAAGNDSIKADLKKGGVQAIGRSYKVHLDGYNILPLLTLHGAKGIRYPPRVDRAVYTSAGTADLQSPSRSLRALIPYFEHLLRLGDRPCLPAGAGAGLCGEFPEDLQGVSAAPEGSQLQPGPGDGKAQSDLTLTHPTTINGGPSGPPFLMPRSDT
jgi:arylsulfatase